MVNAHGEAFEATFANDGIDAQTGMQRYHLTVDGQRLEDSPALGKARIFAELILAFPHGTTRANYFGKALAAPRSPLACDYRIHPMGVHLRAGPPLSSAGIPPESAVEATG